MLKVVSFKTCPFVQRVVASLVAKGIDYEVEYINLKEKPEWFLAASPNGQVPIIITEGGTALFESDAIVEYIDDAFGPLEADLSPEQKALDRAWSYQASKHYLAQAGVLRSRDKATFEEKSAKLAKAFAKAEKQLGEGPYFKGSTLSKVDIAWLTLLHRAAIVDGHVGYDCLAGFPKVKAWQQALLATGLGDKAVAPGFKEAFTGFYLAEETFLGGGG